MLFRRVFLWALFFTAALGLLAKGKGRIAGIAAAASAFLANVTVVMIDFD
jgi:hypothetical protein